MPGREAMKKTSTVKTVAREMQFMWWTITSVAQRQWWAFGQLVSTVAMAAIRATNRCRSNELARKLRELANRYDTRPRDEP